MAFVKEDVLGNNMELYESFNLYYDGKKRNPNGATQWQVDKERDIHFIFLGGGALERPKVYALIWKGEKVIISVESRPQRKGNVHWLIEEIKASKNLEQYKDELVEIIKEVAEADYGCEVVFMKFPEPIFVEEERLNG